MSAKNRKLRIQFDIGQQRKTLKTLEKHCLALSWHTLEPLAPAEHHLKKHNLPVGHVHSFMSTVYTSSDDCFQEDKTQSHEAQIISNQFLNDGNGFLELK